MNLKPLTVPFITAAVPILSIWTKPPIPKVLHVFLWASVILAILGMTIALNEAVNNTNEFRKSATNWMRSRQALDKKGIMKVMCLQFISSLFVLFVGWWYLFVACLILIFLSMAYLGACTEYLERYYPEEFKEGNNQ
jgi:hypothetical protein